MPSGYAVSVYRGGMGSPGCERQIVHMNSAGRVASIDQARRQAWKRRTKGLTDSERQVLLDEVAKISAELCDLQVWAANITRRAANTAINRVDRTA
jgi:hypothetical protein